MNNKLAYLITTLCLSISLPLYADYEEPNDPNAMFDLAFRYYNGDGVKKNYAEAFKWFRKAAYKGNTVAMYNLAVCYNGGIGVEKNPAEAVRWWLRAADRGYADAMYKLGERYRSGYGVDKSIPKSIEWYQKAVKYYKDAADRGDSDAMYKLGRCYLEGRGVFKSEEKGKELYEKAAQCGNTNAMYDFAQHYRRYDEQFYNSEYRRLLERAAWGGHIQAMYELGLGLREASEDVVFGRTNVVNYSLHSEAVEWIRKAAKLGHEDAKRTLNWLRNEARYRRSYGDGFDGEL